MGENQLEKEHIICSCCWSQPAEDAKSFLLPPLLDGNDSTTPKWKCQKRPLSQTWLRFRLSRSTKAPWKLAKTEVSFSRGSKNQSCQLWRQDVMKKVCCLLVQRCILPSVSAGRQKVEKDLSLAFCEAPSCSRMREEEKKVSLQQWQG